MVEKSAFYIGGWLRSLAASSFQTSMFKAGRRHGCGNVILNKCFTWECAAGKPCFGKFYKSPTCWHGFDGAAVVLRQLTSHVMVEQPAAAGAGAGCSQEELGHESADCLKTDLTLFKSKNPTWFFGNAFTCYLGPGKWSPPFWWIPIPMFLTTGSRTTLIQRCYIISWAFKNL